MNKSTTIGGLFLALSWASAICAQEAQSRPPNYSELWDSLLSGAQAEAPPSSVLTLPQAEGKSSVWNFPDHFFFEGRADYYRYDTSFNSAVPTITGIINEPNNGVFNPQGYPYAQIFQPGVNRFETLVDLGTRGWGSERVNTHITVLQEQDLTTVNQGAPAENIIETFPGNREYQLLQASVEIHGLPEDGYWSGLSAEFGRINVYGAELASLDGGVISLDRPGFSVALFGGRRFTYYSDPAQRGIGGINFAYKLNQDTILEYDGLWYVRGTHRVGFRKRLGPSWIASAYYRMVGGYPVDLATQVIYAPQNGKNYLSVRFLQRLSSKDYFYDFTELARNRDTYLLLPALQLGPLEEFSQFALDAHRTINSRSQVGGSVWVRRLLDSKKQGPFDTSFEDYRVNGQIFPLRKTVAFLEYHQRNSDRLSPLGSTSLYDVLTSGETSVKDITAELRQSFGEGRVGLNGGVYYRRVSMQDQFYYMKGLHQSGWTAGGWWKIDSHQRVFVDYNLDSDFFLFMPDLKNSRALHVGIAWNF